MTRPWWHVFPTDPAADWGSDSTRQDESRAGGSLGQDGGPACLGARFGGPSGTGPCCPEAAHLCSSDHDGGGGGKCASGSLSGASALVADAASGAYFLLMCASTSERGASGAGGLSLLLPSRAANNSLFTFALPPLAAKARTSSGFQPSRFRDFTLEICAPNERWTPAQSMQIIVPLFTDAQSGPGAPQSAQPSLPLRRACASSGSRPSELSPFPPTSSPALRPAPAADEFLVLEPPCLAPGMAESSAPRQKSAPFGGGAKLAPLTSGAGRTAGCQEPPPPTGAKL
mmetsp:Transcript_24000/g.66748  ORF Transcript_24000/g.66748 Transcript_24000/m.66748 type:complete len:286 (+) Transcript_24000:608-1465(+)